MREPILIFSDLHLAHPGCRIKSVESLAPLFEGAGTVILNGDTCEQRHRDWADEGRRKLDELRTLLDRLGVSRTVFLRGNHDPWVSEQDQLDLESGRVFICHGDAVFRHVSPWSTKIWPVIPKMDALWEEYDAHQIGNDLETRLEYTHQCRTMSRGTGGEFDMKGRFSNVRAIARIAWPPRRPMRILKTWFTIPLKSHEFLERYRPETQVM